MNSNYYVAYKSEWDKLKKLNPSDIANRLNVEYDNEKKQFIVPFLEKEYILDIKTEAIYRKYDNFKPSIGDCIIILNYLTYSDKYIIKSNKWITLKEIPNGGALFYPAFHKMTISELIKKFGHNIMDFKINAKKLNGNKIKFGDLGFEFNVLPKVSICVAIWSGDDEIDANATILFDSSIEHLIHIETIIGVGMCLSEKLILA